MASAIGSALISAILEPMAAKAMEKVKAMVVDKVHGIVNIKRDISRLQTTLRMIQDIVRVAEKKQIDDDFIRNWLRDLVDIGYEARDVLEDFITFSSCTITTEEASKPVNLICSLMMSCFCGSSRDTSKLPLATLNQLEKDIKNVRERFDEKKKEAEEFKTLISVVGGGSRSVRVDRRSEVGPWINRDALFLGREEVMEEIMKKLLHPSDDVVHVVLIWGMGGIGKTALAQSIYNDERVKKDEYPTKNRRWLCVGEKKFSAKKVIKEIINDLSNNNYDYPTEIKNLQTKLVDELRGDRFLIVLDDFWDVDGSEWDLLFNPLIEVGKGGLIIITSRKSEVCTATNTETTYNLRPLSEQDSWSIFESCAYVNGQSDSTPDLKGIGKQIVKKLNGLPLALKVVGHSLLDEDYSTWTNFLENKFTEYDEVMSALRLSYNHLPRHLKMCFTYCALFPKDHVLDKKVLVGMWMAHDLIQKEEKKRLEDVGAHYFEELVNASLLQCVDGKYTMHDLIHDLALLVSNGEFATANGSLSIDQMIRHITITHGDYSKILRLCKIEKLLTLYATRNQIHTTEKFDFFVRDDVFKQLKSIRVLVLVSWEITDIPDNISELRHLRYLDVSKTRVKCLPDSLCLLYNLQMLATPLDELALPIDIVNISSLRYLRARLSTCKGVGKLTSLQELSSIHVCEGDNIRELGEMQKLHGRLSIKGLENVTSSEDVAGALMEKQERIDELELVFDKQLEESTISEEVLDALGCPPNLTYLRIAGYNGLKPPSWMVDGKHKFYELQTLELFECPKLESLPPLGELTSLKRLYLHNVGVKRLGDEFYGKFTKNKVFFPRLESLHFSDMKEWEEWNDIIIENSSVSFFPHLTTLELSHCPKLESLPPLGELTSLKHLSLESVGVKRLGEEFYGKITYDKVFFPSLESLKFSFMLEWEEWDDIIIKNPSVSFFPHLTELTIHFCPNLVSVLHVVKNPIMNAASFMTSLSHLKIRGCGGLKWLQLDALVSLKELEIYRCKSLVQITSAICERLQISSCRLLEKMDVARCDSLKVVIKSLELQDCESLRSLCIDIHGLDSLEHLHITGCPKLELAFEDGSSSSSSSGNLVVVPIHNISTDNTQVFRTLLHHEIVSLESLDITNLGGFENFDETEANNFCKLRSLKSLIISQCKDLKSLPADFYKLSSLEKLDIYDCPQLQHYLPSTNSQLL